MTERARRSARLALAGALALAPSLAAAQQTVRGLVVNAKTQVPVDGASVFLVGPDNVVRGAADTDSTGQFTIAVPAPGTYVLRVQRVGFVRTAPHSLTVPLNAVVSVQFNLTPDPVSLDAVTIRGDAPAPPTPRTIGLEMRGYYDRKARYGAEGSGFARFLDREDIEATNPMYVSDVVRMLPGIRVVGAGGRRQVITMHPRGGLQRRCIPSVFIDGIRAGNGASVDELISPSSLAAMEVYPGLVAPAEFGGGVGCGVIAVWTGYAGSERREPDEDVSLVPGLMTPSEPPRFSLLLTLSSDSTSPADTVWASLTINNTSGDSASLCITASRYTVRGSRTDRTVAEPLAAGRCLHTVDLEGRESRTWREALAFVAALEGPDEVVVQKELRVRDLRCGDGEQCEVEVRSQPQLLTLGPS